MKITLTEEGMIPAEFFDAELEFLARLAIHTTAIPLLLRWLASDRKASAEEIIVAHDVVLENTSDADFVAKVLSRTGLDLRSQLTVEQAEELRSEIELLKWGGRRN